MEGKRFDPREFQPTKYSTTADKATFANHFVLFVSSGFSRDKFPKWFYNRLSMTFGNIALHNKESFYSYFFESLDGKTRFVEQCLKFPCYGDPAYTFSDVEKKLQEWLSNYGILERLKADLISSEEAGERSLLRALAKKYPEEVA